MDMHRKETAEVYPPASFDTEAEGSNEDDQEPSFYNSGLVALDESIYALVNMGQNELIKLTGKLT